MSINLISEADYERLPSDPSQKFAAIEEICRRNMLEAISNDSSSNYDELVRTTYMTIVSAAAEELGIEGVRYVEHHNTIQQDVQEFIRSASGVVAKIRIRKSSGRDTQSVRLANKTKGIIENEVSKLREAVANSDLEEDRKRKLVAKIEEFRSELHKERLSYAPTFATLALIAATLGGTTSFLADAPDAVTNIMRLIGQDKEKEEAEVLRLDGPPKVKLLTEQPTGKTGRFSRDLDEDIPF
ncbi:MAG: hypothetical protein EON58_13995 [Alphaproteobacteria bacterium]|nr:MAG: hypothetical protein EON58_13995 [Alphaproteobacteria bacterium]